MFSKTVFLLVFIPTHSFLTLLAVQRLYNPPSPGFLAALWKTFAIALASPVLLPLILLDPDGDKLPKWLQWLSFPFNSLVWAGAILLAAGVMKWLWMKWYVSEKNQGV